LTVIHKVLKKEEVKVGMSVSVVVEGKLLTDKVANITDEHLFLGVAIPINKIDKIFLIEIKNVPIDDEDLEHFSVRPNGDVPSS
jgi:hypothetical protein